MKIDCMRALGYIVYAVGVVGCVEGVYKASYPISIGGMIVVVIGSILLSIKPKRRK